MNESDSPCNGICIIDEDTHLCIGCLRTSDEITNWCNYDISEKEDVLSKINNRKNLVNEKS
ncbi:MAG: DUF1289 domain-containing protein [Candidatus Dadabacteria bacterium]|nr:DUF1289 domain-containing protein [Candidatus Dadabacteria bacterium]NIQ12938.1 DUF1289 domain-containing protein [Candidatus Dadabacteria bacterium]